MPKHKFRMTRFFASYLFGVPEVTNVTFTGTKENAYCIWFLLQLVSTEQFLQFCGVFSFHSFLLGLHLAFDWLLADVTFSWEATCLFTSLFFLLLGLGCSSTSVCLKIFSVQFLVPSARVIRFSKWGSSSVFSAWPSFSSVNWETKSGSWVYNGGTQLQLQLIHLVSNIYVSALELQAFRCTYF